MKKVFLSSILLLSALSLNAQLVVDQNGDIAMKGPLWSGFSVSVVTGEHKNMYIRNQGYTGTSWATALETDAAPISNKWGVGVQGTAYRSTENAGSGRNFGVIGRAGNATNGYNYGVFGQLLSNTYGAAVFGTTSETTFGDNLTKKYAGYFQGPVTVTGELTASGGLIATVLGMSSTHSGAVQTTTTKTDSATELLQGLTASTFYKAEDVKEDLSGDSVATIPELSVVQQQTAKKIHYGLSADQMETVFPDLVYETEDGEKAINYMELVPVLVQAINELNFQLSILKSGSSMMVKTTTDIETVEENGMNVYIPSNIQRAYVYLYNLNGKKILSREITTRGNQEIQFDELILDNGIYIYSVIADDRIIKTRKVIIGD